MGASEEGASEEETSEEEASEEGAIVLGSSLGVKPWEEITGRSQGDHREMGPGTPLEVALGSSSVKADPDNRALPAYLFELVHRLLHLPLLLLELPLPLVARLHASLELVLHKV